MPTGGGIFGGQTHSQSPEALFTHVSGLKTVVPSNPYDAKGLLIAAIEDPDPVIFLEPKRLYNGPFDGHHDRPVTPWSKHDLGEVPMAITLPLGKAAIRRRVRPSRSLPMAPWCMSRRPRPRRPASMPRSSICGAWCRSISTRSSQSVAKTGRCVVVHEATLTSGFGAELAALVQEHCFYHLEAPVTFASPAGTRPIRMRRNGPISPARPASGSALARQRWRPADGRAHHQACPMSAKASPRRSSSSGTSRSATSSARMICWPP
jgi:2-oxoisovalerate dehydrogenase E1 component beta subunit